MSLVASPFGRWERSSSLVWATFIGACLAFIADLMFAICLLRSYISCKFSEKWACSLLWASEHSPILAVKLCNDDHILYVVVVYPDLVGGVPWVQHGSGCRGKMVLHLSSELLTPSSGLYNIMVISNYQVLPCLTLCLLYIPVWSFLPDPGLCSCPLPLYPPM